ncbi:uncharacterized protein [Miscanthus floridulus]|uniref:uncharacterized protein n=1 Tax=Miscanthus floridulus TaxID=154761 RepID=UPI00345AFB20
MAQGKRKSSDAHTSPRAIESFSRAVTHRYTGKSLRKEGDGVSQNSKGSGSYGPATLPPRVRPDGAGVLELTVEDTDALDCGVCFLPLKPPIFQCSNGHVVCSLCHDKLKATGKCHVCGVTTDGNSRCHAMERLAESIRFLCSNAAYGCTARLVYHDREGHWQQCPHGVAIGPLACVHGWPSFTTALASGHFNVSLHDGFNFLRAEDHDSSSPGILFILNVVRMHLAVQSPCFASTPVPPTMVRDSSQRNQSNAS